MSYRVIMSDGQEYRAGNVCEKGSFLVLEGGSSAEVRVPLSKVKQIESSDRRTCAEVVIGGLLVILTLGALA